MPKTPSQRSTPTIPSKKRLLAYAAQFPELCQQTDDDEQGGLWFEIDKSRISIRLTVPYSGERRKAASNYAKQNSLTNTKHIIFDKIQQT